MATITDAFDRGGPLRPSQFFPALSVVLVSTFFFFSFQQAGMLYFIYVLAIFCSTVFSFKLQIHGNHTLVANTPIEISWQREHHTDPTSVQVMMENLIGGEMIPVPSTDASSMRMSIAFAPGTFRLWAVNPANDSESYAMSKPFIVLASTEGGDVDPISSDGDPSALTTSPPPAASGTGQSKSTVSTGAIVGAVIGGTTLLVLLLALVYLFCRRRDARVQRRVTFNRARMVRSLRFSAPSPVSVPGDPEANLRGGEREMAEKGQLSIPTGASVSPAPSAHGSRFLENLSPGASGPYAFARTE